MNRLNLNDTLGVLGPAAVGARSQNRNIQHNMITGQNMTSERRRGECGERLQGNYSASQYSHHTLSSATDEGMMGGGLI